MVYWCHQPQRFSTPVTDTDVGDLVKEARAKNMSKQTCVVSDFMMLGELLALGMISLPSYLIWTRKLCARKILVGLSKIGKTTICYGYIFNYYRRRMWW